MKKIFLILTIFTLFFVSCVSAPDFLMERNKWSFPAIGSIATSFIGDTIIKEGVSDCYDAVILKKNHGIKGWSAYHPEGTYKYCGEKVIKKYTRTGESYDQNGRAYDKITVKVFSFPNMETNGWTEVYPTIYKFPDGDFYLNTNTGYDKLKKEEYIEKKVYDVQGYYFEQQLIYTGAEGNILKFSYREFADNLARASFTVDATYDISKDKICRFKNCAFQVIKIDNQSITYKLLSGFKTDSDRVFGETDSENENSKNSLPDA